MPICICIYCGKKYNHLLACMCSNPLINLDTLESSISWLDIQNI